jgi:hypothetical protein
MGWYLQRRPLLPQLQPARLRLYLDTLAARSEIEGAIVEVGCFRGATTVLACQYLRALGRPHPYTVVDTFNGFVADQFAADERIGTPASFGAGFAENPKLLVERTLRHYRLDEVQVIEADIESLDPDRLPDRITVCLMDVDLAVPIEAGLTKIWPRMTTGGVVLIDDCDEGTGWRGARVGYESFCRQHRLEPTYTNGFGLLTVSDPDA